MKKGTALPVTRKLFFTALGWVCGLLIFLTFGTYAKAVAAIAGTALSVLFYGRKRFNFVLLIALSAVLGSTYFSLYKTLCYDKITAFDGREITVTGTVTDYSYTSGSVKLTVRGRINGGIVTTVAFFVNDENFDYYDKVSVKGKVAVQQNTVNFNSEDYTRSQGIYLRGTGTAECTKIGGCTNRIFRAVKHFRSYTLGRIYSQCGGQSGAFLTAVLCSDKSKLSAASRSAVYRSGLGHIFAVSGTHVVILGSLLASVLTKIFVSPKRRNTLIIAAIWSFALFAGLSPSVVRACIMMTFSLTAVYFRRYGDSANSLGGAAILLTLGCPYVITSASFLLSFTAAFAIGVISPAVCKGRVESGLAKNLVSYICITICTLPLCAYFFSEISLISFFSNLIMIPLCTYALSLSFIYMITGSRLTFLIKAADIFAGAVLKLCAAVAKSRLAYVGTHNYKTLVIWGILAILTVIFCAVKREKKKNDIGKILGVYLVVCLEISALARIPVKDRIIILPDGNTYTAVIVSGGEALVFDMGDKGEYAYNVNSLLCEYHISDSYIFISKQAVFTKAVYENNLSDGADYFSPTCGDDAVMYADGETVIGAIHVVSNENGFSVQLDESEIIFESDEIFVNGEEFFADSFDWTSEILL